MEVTLSMSRSPCSSRIVWRILTCKGSQTSLVASKQVSSTRSVLNSIECTSKIGKLLRTWIYLQEFLPLQNRYLYIKMPLMSVRLLELHSTLGSATTWDQLCFPRLNLVDGQPSVD